MLCVYAAFGERLTIQHKCKVSIVVYFAYVNHPVSVQSFVVRYGFSILQSTTAPFISVIPDDEISISSMPASSPSVIRHSARSAHVLQRSPH